VPGAGSKMRRVETMRSDLQQRAGRGREGRIRIVCGRLEFVLLFYIVLSCFLKATIGHVTGGPVERWAFIVLKVDICVSLKNAWSKRASISKARVKQSGSHKAGLAGLSRTLVTFILRHGLALIQCRNFFETARANQVP
jgi:hypothetical protein